MADPVLCLNSPTTYRIQFQGHLDDSGLEGLEGFTRTEDIRAGQAPQITLSGRFADQGTLIRMLDALLEHGLAVALGRMPGGRVYRGCAYR